MTSRSVERTPAARDDVERARPSRWSAVVIPSLLGCATVVLLLGLMPNRFGPYRRPTNETALNQMKSLGGAIDLYFLENRSLPTSLDVLAAPAGKMNEPYLKSIPSDPWRNPYEYRIVNATTHEYRISCSGEDKRFGTEDDLVFPEPESGR